MNYTDPYTQKNINGFFFPAFGLQSVQVSPGSENETFGNSGVGTVNVTARRGTFPGTVDAAFGVGGPGFFHEADVGIGNATPNGRWSNYFELYRTEQRAAVRRNLLAIQCQRYRRQRLSDVHGRSRAARQHGFQVRAG